MKKSLAFIVVVSLLSGCGDGPTYPSTPHGGQTHDVRTYTVTYRVVGQFEKATVLYCDKYGMQVEAGVVNPGWSVKWSESIDYTYYPYKGLSLVVLAQDITGPGSNRSISVEILVNGSLVNSQSKNNPDGEYIVVQAHGGINYSGIFASPYKED